MAREMAVAKATTNGESDLDHLPALLGRLGDQVTDLVDTKIGLLKVELKEEANIYLRGGLCLAAAGGAAGVGFALVSVAIAFGVSMLFAVSGMAPPATYAAGFAATGLLYLIVGSAAAVMMKNRLVQHNPAPDRTIQELKKDTQWLKKEV